MKRSRAWGGAALLAAALAAALFLHFHSGPRETARAGAPPVVPVAAVTREDLAKSIEVTAEFRPYQAVDLHAKVSGYVQSIGVDIGDRVHQGQVVAQLEVPELKEDLKKAQATVEASKQEAIQADNAYQDAHLAFTRLAEVAKSRPNLIAQQDLDTANAHDGAAAAALASSRSRIEEAQANLAKMVTLLGYTLITAPFDGVVTHRFADVGSLVQAGTASNTQAMPVVSLAEEDRLRLVFPVPESAAPLVRIGQEVAVTLPALGRTFPAKVARLNGRIDTATRTMETEADVPNPDLLFKPGMYASVRLTLDAAPAALSIPVQAVSSEDRKSVLILDPSGKIERRAVTLGMETPFRVEVLSGLAEHEEVVVGGRQGLQPGQSAVGKPVATGGKAAGQPL